MALDWSKNINFAGLFKRKPRSKDVYPSKTYMNMALPDEQERNIRQSVITAVLTLVVALIFGKFGVYDFYDRVFTKNNELIERKAVLSEIQAQLTDYNSILETYRMYEAVRMTSDAGDVAAVDALALVDGYIRPVAQLNTLGLSKNTLSLNLTGISLDGVGDLVSTLYQQPMVAGVTVSTASDATSSRDNAVAMTIALQSVAAAEAATSEAVTSGGSGNASSDGSGSGNAGEGVLTDDEKTEIRQQVISNLSGNGQTYADSATVAAEQNAQNNS